MKFIKTIKPVRILIILCLSVIVFQLLQVVYFQKEIFGNSYDATYWKDRVEHSRYMLPLSNRGIGDDQFYAYGGYKIFDGEDPTKVVYDKPALGISILGFFSYYLDNPAYSGLFFGIGIIVLTYFIIYKITNNIVLGLLVATFLTLDPLFISNLSTSLLDLPQLFLLLINILLVVSLKEKKKYFLLLIFSSGLALGLFAQIKIPVVYPIIFLMEIIWLFKTFGKSAAVMFVIGNVSSLLIGYIPYAIHGYSFVEFLKIQKFVLAFYRDSNLPLHPEAIWQFLFSGSFPGVVDRIPSKVAEWSYIYPLATIVGIVYAIKSLFDKNEKYIVKTLALVLVFSLIIFTFIPSFPRYILLILPFLYFFALKAIAKNKLSKKVIFVIILLSLYALVNNFYYFHQSPSAGLSYFYKNFTHEYFQDIYQEQIDTNTKTLYSRDEFKKIGMKIFADAEIRNVEIIEDSYQYSPFDRKVIVPVEIKYKTSYLGGFSEKKNIEVIRENGKWKVKWQWSYLLNDLSESDSIVSTRIIGSRGKIINRNGIVLAEDTDGHMISINPQLMDGTQEKEMLQFLSTINRLSETDIQNTYLENPMPNTHIRLFTAFEELTPAVLDKLRQYKGIKYEAYPTRIYTNLDQNTITNTYFEECCTRIYSSYNYHGHTKKPGAELDYDKELSGYDGGSLLILDKNGTKKRTIIEKEAKNGQDITLTE